VAEAGVAEAGVAEAGYIRTIQASKQTNTEQTNKANAIS
jgi:hypothetical protein